MGPRKRSKPNPEAENEPVSEGAPLLQGPEVQNKDSHIPTIGELVPSDKLESVEPVLSSVNGANTVRVEDGQLIQNKTNHV